MPRHDVHMERPEVAVPVRRVGVTGIRVPVHFIFFEKQPAIVVPTFDVYVDLPAYQKGIHISRSYEATVEIITQQVSKLHRLENLCADIAKELLRRHDYATEADVRAAADVVYERSTPETASRTFESCTMKARAIARRGESGDFKLRRWIGVTVSGITSCPCAQELLRSDAEAELVKTHKLQKGQAHRIVQDLAIGSHMQRSYGTVMVELPDRYSIDAHQLIEVIDRSMSAASYELLKRPDEMAVVRTALANPRFVEDSVRFMIRNVVQAFPDLPDNMQLQFNQRNEECVHRHDVVAEQALTMGQARREIAENHNSAGKHD